MGRPHLSCALRSCALVALLSGCDDTLECDTSAAYSVTVSVFDPDGEPYAPEDVTYTVDDGPEDPCEPISEGTEFLCGVEEVGLFVIRVYDGGAVVAEEELDVGLDEGGCHVAAEFVDVTVP